MRQFFALIAALFAVPAVGQDAVEIVVAKEVLTRIQPHSFAKKREYCGYIGYNADGIMVATPPVPGDLASCGAPFPRDIAVTASYHTHGDFDEGYFNEVPSVVDMEGEREFYMNGYVATPGGRLWFIDSQRMVTYQLCGVSCLPSASGFRKNQNDVIAEEYTLDALREKLGE